MRGLGQDFVLALIKQVVEALPARREEILKRLKERFKDEEIAKAAVRIVDPGFDLLRLWAWISGVPLSRNELSDLGQTQDLTQTEAAIFIDRIARSKAADEIADLLKKGIPAINEVISALHHKFILDELTLLGKQAEKKTK